MNFIVKSCTVLLPAFAFCNATSATAPSKIKKNILFILVDDMQFQSIHALGCQQVSSPNIDGLIGRGTTFTRAYTNGSIGGALSMPSRAMLLTGRGVFQLQSDGQTIPSGHVTLPEALRRDGYKTFATGKWHSDKVSFNRSFGQGENIFFGGMHPYETNGHLAPKLYHYDTSGKYETSFTGDKFSSEMFADAAVRFIHENGKSKNPFFAWVAFTSPHDPRGKHPEYGMSYDSRSIELPVNFLPQHPFDNGDMNVRDERILPAPRSADAMKKDLADYYGMISEVDVQIGRILEALKKSGQEDRTIIVFASDNGLAMGQHGLLGKQNLYEHSIGVPLVFVSGEVKANVRSDVNCYLYDIYPTLCEMVGVGIPSSVSGKSLVPVFEGSYRHREHVFLAYSSIQRALVKDSWKYIIYNVNGFITEQLFDLNNDPWEMVNHAGDPKYAFRLSSYKRILQEEMKKADDFCDLSGGGTWWGRGLIPWSEGLKLYTFD